MRMAMAVEQLNYEGTMVHMHGDQADILQIVHRVEDGRVSERIAAVDGPGREIIRHDDEVTCIFPDQQAVIVEPRDETNSKQSPLQGRLPRLDAFDERFYALDLSNEPQSAAGRATRVLVVRPLDQYRYGYRLWLDEDTGMPLKSELRSGDGSVIEQIMFTDIKIRDSIPPEAVQSSLDTGAFQWQHATNAPESAKLSMNWQATRLPDGFRPIAARAKLAPGAAAPTEQLVFTDGLATVSVFIDMGPGEADEGEGLSTMGAANAFTAKFSGYMITAVGEVPVPTVELIAVNMRPARGDQ